MSVLLTVLLHRVYPNIESGERAVIFSKRKYSFFFGKLKWTTAKLYNLPSYFCPGL